MVCCLRTLKKQAINLHQLELASDSFFAVGQRHQYAQSLKLPNTLTDMEISKESPDSLN